MQGKKLTVSSKIATLACQHPIVSKLGTACSWTASPPRKIAMHHMSLQYVGSWGNKSSTDGELLEWYHSIHHAPMSSISKGYSMNENLLFIASVLCYQKTSIIIILCLNKLEKNILRLYN